MAILGYFAPLPPWGSKTRIFPGSRIPKSFVYRLCSCFWKVSEKSNERKKIYGAKSFIFCHFGLFWPLLTPWGCEPEFCRSQRYRVYVTNNCGHLLAKFQKNLMKGSKVMRGKVSFWPILGHFGVFLTTFYHLGLQ